MSTTASTTAYGSKLQALINNGCLDDTRAAGLSTQQLDKIESLSWIEVGALIQIHSSGGPLPGLFMI